MSRSGYAILRLVVLLLMTAQGVAGADLPPPLTPARMREDLLYLRDVWSPRDKSFSVASRSRFNAAVDAAIAEVDTLTPVEFSLRVSRAVALAGNGHTNAELGPHFHALPLRAAWFPEGLFIVRTAPGHTELLGARIDRFGPLTAEQALQRIAPYISGTRTHVRVLSPAYLRFLEILQTIGATQSSRAVKLRLTLRNGRTRAVTVGAETVSNSEHLPQHQQLISRKEDTPAADRWPHLLDAIPNVPAAFRRVVDVDEQWLPADRRILYIRSDMIASATPEGTPFETKLWQALAAAQQARPKVVIVDLRFNSGGYLLQTVVVANGLPRVLPDGGKLFVLVGPETWSAAIAMTAMLKGNGRERVVLVGDTMGDNPQFWAEGEPLPLPNSGIQVQYASGYHDWANGCGGHPECFWGSAAFAKPEVSLEPEIKVSMTFDDYVSGRDTVLEAALTAAAEVLGEERPKR